MIASIIIISIISAFVAILYSKSWIFISTIFFKENLVPTGFGIFFVFAMFPIFFSNYENNSAYAEYFFFLGLILISLIYWIDDLIGLPARIRFFLQFFLGALISYYLLQNSELNYVHLFISITLIGLSSIFFTNVINFYDGLDLNISVLVIISLILAYYFNADIAVIDKLIIYCIGVTIGFSIVNFFPKTLYFGDSGCFVFTGILTYIIISNLFINNYSILIVLITLVLPSIDLIYVNLLRIYLKEDLFSRNYYYLYQITYNKFKNYTYLILQPLNIFLIFIMIITLEKLGIQKHNSIIFSSLFSSLIFYFSCRFFFTK